MRRLGFTKMNQSHNNWHKQQFSVQVCHTMEPHFLSMERKLEPDGENRDLVFLVLTSLWPLAASCFSGEESQAEPSVLLIIKPKHAAASFPQHQGQIWEITITIEHINSAAAGISVKVSKVGVYSRVILVLWRSLYNPPSLTLDQLCLTAMPAMWLSALTHTQSQQLGMAPGGPIPPATAVCQLGGQYLVQMWRLFCAD